MTRIRIDQSLFVSPLPDDIRLARANNHDLILQVPDGMSIHQTLNDLNIKLNQGVIALLDGQTIDLCQPLNGNVEVHLLPQIAGGD